MQVNKYHNSISEPAARKGIPQPSEQDQLTKTLKMIAYNETRRLMEIATKFMRNSRSEELSLGDMQSALLYMGNRDIKLSSREPAPDAEPQDDPIIHNLDKFLESELKSISNIEFKPKTSGRWIYINGKVPRTEQNINIKRYQQIKEQLDKEDENNKFNIIYDQPINMLTREEDDFYNQIVTSLSNQQVPEIKDSNPNNIFPYIIAYLVQTEPKDTKIKFLIQLLHNKNIELVVEHHLHQILAVLKNYTGPLMWDVGMEIARVLNCWGNKYQNIYQQMTLSATTYPAKIRKLAMLTYFKLPIEIESDALEKDIAQNIPYADEYKQRIGACSSRLKEPMAHSELLVEGLAGLEADHFLSTML